MKLVRCPQKHFYDGEAFPACPHCSDDIQPSVGKTVTSMSTSNMPFSAQPMSVTMPLNESVSQYAAPPESPPEIPAAPPVAPPPAAPDASQAASPASMAPSTPTIPPTPPVPQNPTAPQTPAAPQETSSAPPVAPIPPQSPLAGAVSASVRYALPNNEIPNNEIQKTVGFYDFGGTEPVVGWLVCVKGAHHGQSFQLKSGQNIIGRDLKMDVALTKDANVSRNRHAVIMFDPKNCRFYLQQGENGLTYLKGDLVLVPTPLEARAIIGIGGGEYLFVPLCGDSFSWDDYKQ